MCLGCRLLKHDNVNTMCVEKRAFYRLISGLHTSITTHVCSDFYGMRNLGIRLFLCLLELEPSGFMVCRMLIYNVTLVTSLCFCVQTDSATNTWGPNAEMFYKKFAPDYTWEEGPHRLRNLYFSFLFVLRAIDKASVFSC